MKKKRTPPPSPAEARRRRVRVLKYLNDLPDNVMPSMPSIARALGYSRNIERVIVALRADGLLEINRERGLFGTAKKPMPEHVEEVAPAPPRWIDQPESGCEGVFVGREVGDVLYADYGVSIRDAEMYSFRGVRPKVCRRGGNKDFGWRGVKGARPAAEAW